MGVLPGRESMLVSDPIIRKVDSLGCPNNAWVIVITSTGTNRRIREHSTPVEKKLTKVMILLDVLGLEEMGIRQRGGGVRAVESWKHAWPSG
jgi:hypothetical protein